MFRNSYQRGLLSIFYSCGSKPLHIWDVNIKNGYMTKLMDKDIRSTVLEIGGTNITTAYMSCPKGKDVLGINMPFLVMIVKNLKKYFSFEVTILDDTGTRRRFRVSNFQKSTQIQPLCTCMPICLSDGWNQIQFNLAEFTQRAYKKQFVEVQRIKINANIRLRRIYFSEYLYPEDQLPADYKLYFPLEYKRAPKQHAKDKEVKAAVTKAISQDKIGAEAVPVVAEKLSETQIVPEVVDASTEPASNIDAVPEPELDIVEQPVEGVNELEQENVIEPENIVETETNTEVVKEEASEPEPVEDSANETQLAETYDLPPIEELPEETAPVAEEAMEAPPE